MPRQIASRQIASRAIASRRIGSASSSTVAAATYTANLPAGTTAWTVPASGTYKFVAWGAGFNGNDTTKDGGGSGSYAEVTIRLRASEVVTLQIGVGNSTTSTLITFPRGQTLTVPASSGRTGGGAPSGYYDYSLSGSDGGLGSTGANGANGSGTGGGVAGAGNAVSSGGGAGAPARLPFMGGYGGAIGGTNAASQAGSPGGGGAPNTTSNPGKGGDGLVIVQRMT